MKYVVGIDEVGRGPLAGPMTVCVIACEEKLYSELKNNRKLPPKGKDSKLSTEAQRKVYSRNLRLIAADLSNSLIKYSISHISSTVIDKKGLTSATKLAIQRGLYKLDLEPDNCTMLLDGGLKAPEEYKNKQP